MFHPSDSNRGYVTPWRTPVSGCEPLFLRNAQEAAALYRCCEEGRSHAPCLHSGNPWDAARKGRLEITQPVRVLVWVLMTRAHL
ncbi:hypothetical protein FKM82_028804 [Ascaphus truei]